MVGELEHPQQVSDVPKTTFVANPVLDRTHNSFSSEGVGMRDRAIGGFTISSELITKATLLSKTMSPLKAFPLSVGFGLDKSNKVPSVTTITWGESNNYPQTIMPQNRDKKKSQSQQAEVVKISQSEESSTKTDLQQFKEVFDGNTLETDEATYQDIDSYTEDDILAETTENRDQGFIDQELESRAILDPDGSGDVISVADCYG